MAILHVNFMSQSLFRTVNFLAVLPTDLPAAAQKNQFPALYLLCGLFGGEYDWLYKTHIQKFADEKQLAVIMPAGDNSFFVDHEDAYAMYGEFVGKELVDFTRRTLPLSNKREDTFIGGVSMGGYGALTNGLRYNETFGAIIALSPALLLNKARIDTMAEAGPTPLGSRKYYASNWGKDLYQAIDSNVNPRFQIEQMLKEGISLPNIYIACGEDDRSILPLAKEFDAFLTENGVKHTFEIGPGAHEWNFWEAYLWKSLCWLESL